MEHGDAVLPGNAAPGLPAGARAGTPLFPCPPARGARLPVGRGAALRVERRLQASIRRHAAAGGRRAAGPVAARSPCGNLRGGLPGGVDAVAACIGVAVARQGHGGPVRSLLRFQRRFYRRLAALPLRAGAAVRGRTATLDVARGLCRRIRAAPADRPGATPYPSRIRDRDRAGGRPAVGHGLPGSGVFLPSRGATPRRDPQPVHRRGRDAVSLGSAAGPVPGDLCPGVWAPAGVPPLPRGAGARTGAGRQRRAPARLRVGAGDGPGPRQRPHVGRADPDHPPRRPRARRRRRRRAGGFASGRSRRASSCCAAPGTRSSSTS